MVKPPGKPPRKPRPKKRADDRTGDLFESVTRPITTLTPAGRKVVDLTAAELANGGTRFDGYAHAVLSDADWLKRTRLSAEAFDEAITHLKARGGIKLRRPSKRTAPGTTAIALLPRLALGLGDAPDPKSASKPSRRK